MISKGLSWLITGKSKKKKTGFSQIKKYMLIGWIALSLFLAIISAISMIAPLIEISGKYDTIKGVFK